jgi:hypothetical protein
LAFCGLILLAAILTGCRGGAQTDIVQREMRQQEDKIYAMEDYLAQYQQLLCDVRRENAQLRRQLAERQSAPSTAPDKKNEPAPWTPERSEGPAISPPKSPSSTAPKIEPDAPSFEPAGPEVPPLDTSQNDSSPDAVDRDGIDSAASREPQLLVAFAEEPSVEMPVAGPPQHLWIDGEVVPGDDESGTRLLVDVEPLAAGGGPATFAGTLSLMVLDPDGQQGARSLARWDFSGEDLQRAADETTGGRAMRFRLQLPADAAIERPVELWARLLDDESGKLLAHVEIDFGHPGHFSSVRQSPTDRQLAVQASVHTVVESLPTLDQRPGWSQWQTARPGESNLLAERTGRAEGQWQAAAEPPPTAALGSPSAVLPAAAEEASAPPVHAELAPPRWSPTR